MSGEMLTFHETISKLQEAEDEMVEYHKHLFDKSVQWNQADKMLINLTNQVEYDQEGKKKKCYNQFNSTFENIKTFGII